MAALVVGDYADVGLTQSQVTCLATPAVRVAQQSVQENHRQVRDLGTNSSRHQGKSVAAVMNGCAGDRVHQRGQRSTSCCWWSEGQRQCRLAHADDQLREKNDHHHALEARRHRSIAAMWS